MLADDDLDVDAHVAGTTQNFHYTSDRRQPAAGIAHEFDVDDCAVEFGKYGQAFGARAGFRLFARGRVFSQCGRQFIAGGNFYFLLDAHVVWQHDIAARAVTEKSDNRWCARGRLCARWCLRRGVSR